MARLCILTDYDGTCGQIETVLFGHGQDFVLVGQKEGTQPWGSPDLVIVISAVAIWALKIVGQTLIEEAVKKRSQVDTTRMAELEKRVAELESLSTRTFGEDAVRDEVSAALQAREVAKTLDAICGSYGLVVTIDRPALEKELAEYLASTGLTKRKSRLLASRLISVLFAEHRP